VFRQQKRTDDPALTEEEQDIDNAQDWLIPELKYEKLRGLK
jgi:hypothetical protein